MRIPTFIRNQIGEHAQGHALEHVDSERGHRIGYVFGALAVDEPLGVDQDLNGEEGGRERGREGGREGGRGWF